MNQADQSVQAQPTPPLGAPDQGVAPVSAAASGKAIIVGEHAVVYGARAVAMPVHNLQMCVRLTPTGRRNRKGEPILRVLLGGRTVTAHLSGVLDDAFATLRLTPFALDLEGHSTVLIGAGLGSSASLCVVVLKALADATSMVLSPEELAAHANRLEKRFHGNPSGLDTAVVAMGHTISFVKGQPPTRIPVADVRPGRPWRFVLLDSGARSSTLAMIQSAAPYFRGDDGDRRLQGFDDAAAAVALGLSSGEPALVADAMTRACAWLTEAGIVNEALRDLIDVALGVGCLAAKPTGAGGGGCVLALLADDRAEEQIASLKDRLGASRVFAVELP